MLKPITLVRLSRARDLLSEIREPALSIRDVAREARMSPYHFIRLFEATFGSTPHQYRIQARLENAKRMLAIDNASVTEVCLESGFTSLGSFSDLFARRVGMPPSAYRRYARPFIQSLGVMPHALQPGCFSMMVGPEGIAIFEKHSRRMQAHFTGSRSSTTPFGGPT
jgi:AraC-like DNA-binding protein